MPQQPAKDTSPGAAEEENHGVEKRRRVACSQNGDNVSELRSDGNPSIEWSRARRSWTSEDPSWGATG